MLKKCEWSIYYSVSVSIDVYCLIGAKASFDFYDATLQHCHVDERLNHRRMAETSIDYSHKSTGKATHNTHAHSMKSNLILNSYITKEL